MDSALLFQQERPNQRLSRDLSKRRLFLALGIAPLPPFVIGFLLIMVLTGSPSGAMLTFIGAFLAAAEVWSLVIGTIVLLSLVRMRGALRRVDCLLLGVLLAFSLPYAATLVRFVVDWISSAGPPETGLDDFEGPSDKFVALIVGVILIPFGALGGWILWRAGVRPAPMPAPDVSAVFD